MRAYGLRRRVWRVRRMFPRAVAQPLSAVLPTFDPPEKPIFIIGCPRSGTSILLKALLESPSLGSIQSEGHILWDAYHHARDRGWDSDALDGRDVLPREREYIYAAIRLFVRGRRFVDKTPENCLRIPYLEALFPDATFVFLRRRAADNVSSLMEGWRAWPRFVTYRLPQRLEGLGPLSGNTWSFVLIPGWRDLRSAPLEEICARQYIACNEAALSARERLPADRWIDVAYDDLLDSPAGTVGKLYERLGLEPPPAAELKAAAVLDTPGPTALTPATPQKWREQNREEIERILPLVEPLERRLYGDQAPGSSAYTAFSPVR
jgi:Sulfotransferase family